MTHVILGMDDLRQCLGLKHKRTNIHGGTLRNRRCQLMVAGEERVEPIALDLCSPGGRGESSPAISLTRKRCSLRVHGMLFRSTSIWNDAKVDQPGAGCSIKTTISCSPSSPRNNADARGCSVASSAIVATAMDIPVPSIGIFGFLASVHGRNLCLS